MNDWFASPVFLRPVIKSTLDGTLDTKLVVESLISMPGASGKFFTYDLMRCADSRLQYICLIQELQPFLMSLTDKILDMALRESDDIIDH